MRPTRYLQTSRQSIENTSMKTKGLLSIALTVGSVGLITFPTGPILAQPAIQNVWGHTTMSLDGDWHVIVDPYENGYFNYRYEEADNGYFRNQKPTSVRDLNRIRL